MDYENIRRYLKLWNVEIPKDCEDIPEHLIQKFPSNCFFADFFPKAIPEKQGYKFFQLESKVHNLVFHRMCNTLLKMWVYDTLYFESEILREEHVKKFFTRASWKRRNLSKKVESNCIQDEEQLLALLTASKESLIDLFLLFSECRIMIVPSWFCFFVFIQNSDMIPVVMQTFNMEGLYLRACSTE